MAEIESKRKAKTFLKKSAAVRKHIRKSSPEITKGDHGPIFTIPNMVTFFRVLLLIPLFYFLKLGEEEHGNRWALLVIGLALASDFIDGFLARILKQQTDWGRLFDPLTDKIWIAGMGVFLALPWRQNPLPWGFLLLVLLRDVLIVAGGIHAYKRRGIVLESNVLGKWAMFLTALTLFLYTINFQPPENYSWMQPRYVLLISVVLMILSWSLYFTRYLKLISNRETN